VSRDDTWLQKLLWQEKRMSRRSQILVLVLSLVLTACSGDKPKELLETAELEERQHNVVHAKQLYEDLVRLYPTSPQAEVARARLTSLSQGQ
jgi:outer membrane biogenesis lipoprotein LolB